MKPTKETKKDFSSGIMELDEDALNTVIGGKAWQIGSQAHYNPDGSTSMDPIWQSKHNTWVANPDGTNTVIGPGGNWRPGDPTGK
jgi:hypothetical protein